MKKEKSTKKSGDSKFFRFFRIFFAGIVGAVLHIKVVGGENEPQEGGYVVCANHISATDPICLCYAFKKNQVHFMAKKELFKIPVFSGFIRLLGAFPVDRSGSDVGAIKTAISLVGDGGCLGIFPQGHRYPETDPRETSVKMPQSFRFPMTGSLGHLSPGRTPQTCSTALHTATPAMAVTGMSLSGERAGRSSTLR